MPPAKAGAQRHRPRDWTPAFAGEQSRYCPKAAYSNSLNR